MRDLRSSKHEKLRPFGHVWDGAGIRGLAGEGYWYHSRIPRLSKVLAKSTFVTKTITTDPKEGNMELDESFRPKKRFPDCIYVNFWKGFVVNSVGLSNPGVKAVLDETPLLKRTEPFFISYMPVQEDIRSEVERFVTELLRRRHLFRALHWGIQLNISCPNAHADLNTLALEAAALLDLLTPLRVPIVVKLNLLVEPDIAAKIAQHERCAGLCIANSIPFGTVLPDEWWKKHFTRGSPLPEQYGQGGLSGAPVLPKVVNWLRDFRTLDPDTYVNVGGGILGPRDVDRLYCYRPNSIFFSSAMILRPWQVGRIVRRGHELLD